MPYTLAPATPLRTRVAKIESLHGSFSRDVIVARLSDGKSIRLRLDQPIDRILPHGTIANLHGLEIAYDEDRAGNRANPRIALAIDRQLARQGD
jgi:hypothetical protein